MEGRGGGSASASSARKRNDAQRCAVPCCAVATATVKDVRARFAASESSRVGERQRQRATVRDRSNSYLVPRVGKFVQNNREHALLLSSRILSRLFFENNSRSEATTERGDDRIEVSLAMPSKLLIHSRAARVT